MAEAREQVLVHRRMVDTKNAPVAHDRLACHDQLPDVPRGRACKQQIERVEIGAQFIRIEPVPVEQQDVGRRAGGERTAVVPVRD